MPTIAGRAKSFLNASLGFSGIANLSAWAVAGGFAYYWWVRPEQIKAEERKVSGGSLQDEKVTCSPAGICRPSAKDCGSKQ
jgi:hypothetical protein